MGSKTREQLQRNNQMQHRDMAKLRAENKRLRAALKEACDEYDAAAQYKGLCLRARHRDDETLVRLRSLLVRWEDK